LSGRNIAEGCRRDTGTATIQIDSHLFCIDEKQYFFLQPKNIAENKVYTIWSK
jgi:hypothetical protein